MDHRDAWNAGSVAGDTDNLLSAIEEFRAPLVLVSPEVGLSVVPATRSGRRFADELGFLNQRLAAACDHVVLVVAGLAVWIKPREEP
jgi:adenosylcobinamide kinase/adenosylcobinamide-phosphate guanylyltransferase